MSRSWIYINDERTKYKIDSSGYVVSYAYNGVEGDIRPLKHNDDFDGYSIITLNHKGKKYTRKIHRLVAEAFIPNIEKLPEVNHIDGNKHNNDVSNLEWVDNLTNIRHALHTGLRVQRNTETQVEDVCRLLQEGAHTMPEISHITGVRYSDVQRIFHGVRWKSISSKYDFSKYNKSGYLRGSDFSQSVINECEAHMICRLLQENKTPTEIWKMTKIPRSIIYRIHNRKSWKHISKDYNF